MKPIKSDFAVRTEPEDTGTVEPGVPNEFRRLRWHEPVLAGDFVMDVQRGFQPWEGPGGFRADSFVKPIYRRSKQRAVKEAVKS